MLHEKGRSGPKAFPVSSGACVAQFRWAFRCWRWCVGVAAGRLVESCVLCAHVQLASNLSESDALAQAHVPAVGAKRRRPSRRQELAKQWQSRLHNQVSSSKERKTSPSGRLRNKLCLHSAFEADFTLSFKPQVSLYCPPGAETGENVSRGCFCAQVSPFITIRQTFTVHCSA